MSNWLEFKKEWSVKLNNNIPDTFRRDNSEGVSPLVITGDLTMSFWIMAEDIETYSGNTNVFAVGGAVADETEADNFNYSLLINEDNSDADGWAPTVFHEGTTVSDETVNFTDKIPWGKFAHVAIVRDTANLNYILYVNGVEINTVAYTVVPTGGTSAEVSIGLHTGSLNDSFRGHISSIAIHARMLSDEEIRLSSTRQSDLIRYSSKDLRALWLFGDGNENRTGSVIKDMSKNDMHLTANTGGPGFVRLAPAVHENVALASQTGIDKIATFDGVNERIDFSASPSGLTPTVGDLTYSCHVRFATLSGSTSFINPYIASCSGIGSNDTEAENIVWAMFQRQNGSGDEALTMFHESGAGVDNVVDSTIEVVANNWYTITFVRDTTAKTITFFVNDEKDQQSYTNNATTTGSPDVLIGMLDNFSGSTFDGDMASVAIWNRPLTDEEVSRLYNKGECTSPQKIGDGLVHYWSFGNTGEDSTANGFTDVMGNMDGSTVNMAAGNFVTGSPWINQIGSMASFEFNNGVTNEHVAFAANSVQQLTGDMSLFCWIKPASVQTSTVILNGDVASELQADNILYGLALVDNTSNMLIGYSHEDGAGTNTDITSSTVGIADDEWSFVGFTRNTSTKVVTFFTNGFSEVASAYTTNPDGGGSNAMVLGAQDLVGGLPFLGKVNCVAIYDHALSSDDVDLLFNNGNFIDFRKPISSKPISYYTCGNSGDTVSTLIDLMETEDGVAANMTNAANIKIDSPFT